MGLTAFGTFQRLCKQGHHIRKMGLRCTTADINLLNSRMNVARAFQGIELDGFTPRTVKGYNGLFQVFLTHSAVERYCHVFKRDMYTLAQNMVSYEPKNIIDTFNNLDSGRKFYQFLHKHVNSKLRGHLDACLGGDDLNVAHLSASIRHIFAHGFLTAHANKSSPARNYKICISISDFLLNFVDQEFRSCIVTYCEKIGMDLSKTE